MNPTIASIQVGVPHRRPVSFPRGEARTWRTSFFRVSSPEPRWLFTTHLDGNAQADRKNHGHLDQAMLLYAAAHYPLWRAELGRPEMGPGGFAENLTIAGLTEADVCLGDVYTIGEAQIEISGPRYPCWKIAQRWSIADLTERVAATGRTGWYCRVIREGLIAPGASLLLAARPYPRWTMALINDFAHGRNRDHALISEFCACPLLDDFWPRVIRHWHNK